MYLSTLSGSIVALGLIGGVDGFDDAFFVVALVVLPVVLFVGIGTWLRMGATNYHDAIAVAGMNRIRGAYLEIAPDLEPYFVMGVHDDARGIGDHDGGAARHAAARPPDRRHADARDGPERRRRRGDRRVAPRSVRSVSGVAIRWSRRSSSASSSTSLAGQVARARTSSELQRAHRADVPDARRRAAGA